MFGTALANPDVWLIDVMHPNTHNACWPALKPLLEAFGHARMDNGATMSPKRLLTRQIAGYLHELGATTSAEGRRVAGLRFLSSLWPRWECFALWEPLEFTLESVEPVDIADKDLVSAASKLGVNLA
jgi:hypothetical protein